MNGCNCHAFLLWYPLDLLAYNNEYDVRELCFYTILQVIERWKDQTVMVVGWEMPFDSRAWKCVSPYAIDIYYNPTIILFIRLWTAYAAKVTFMRDIWCRAANKPHTQLWNCCSPKKLPLLLKTKNTHTHRAYKLK